MTRQLKLLSAVMFLFVFASGQSTTIDIMGCQCDLRPYVADVFDGTGCLGGCVGGCGDCGSCMGGCADCMDCNSCGCDGCTLSPIPDGYKGPTTGNAVQVRLSSNAIGFFESMLRPMLGQQLSPFPVLHEEIHEVVKEEVAWVTVADFEIRVCQGATAANAMHCDLSFDITRIELQPQERTAPNPDRLRLLLEIEAWTTHTDVNGNGPIYGWPATMPTSTTSDAPCNLVYDTRIAAPSAILVEMVFDMGTSGVAPRADFNVIDFGPFSPPDNNGNFPPDSGRLQGVTVGPDMGGNCNWVKEQLDGQIGTAVVNSVMLELGERMPQLVRTLLCEHPSRMVDANGNQPLDIGEVDGDGNPIYGACVSPTTLRDYSYGMDGILAPVKRCGPSADACLPILLGMEGRMDLGGLLGSIIPGYSAIVDFLVAAADEATTPNAGLSVWLKGGINAPTGHNDCVPVLPPEEVIGVPTIPRTQLIQGNTTPGGRPTDVLVGVSEQFVNWAAYSLWDSGAICVQIGSTTLPMLDPSLVGILFGTSLKSLVFPASDANSPLGIGLRPQKPPAVTFEELEGEPGLAVNVDMPQIELDFYAWSLDRYVRFVTFVMDINISVQVKTADGKVGIYLGDIGLTNVSSKNDDLLANPGSAVSLLGGVVAGVIPSFLGDSSAPLFELDLATLIPSEIDLGGTPVPLPLGVELREDAFGVVHVDAAGNTVATRDEAADTLMGIFVDFTTGSAPSTGLEGAIETSVEVTSLHIPEDRSAFQAETFAQGELPRVEILMSATAPAGVPLEYRYRLALGGWSEWQDSPYAVIESPVLLLQQEHLIMARARVKGDPRSEDKSSAFTKVRVDVSEPMIELAADSKGVRLQAVDLQTPIKQLEYRFRDPGGEFSEWTAFGEETTALLDAGRDVEVQVRDESGNIGSNVEELRGLPEPSADGGCSCTVAGKPTSSGSTLGFLAMLAVLGGTFFRVRRRRHSA